MYAIVAVDEKWGIGRDNALLFHLPADLKRFKELTSGHTVLMGRRTLQSLPGGRGLPNRRNIVLTGQRGFTAERAEIVHSPAEALLTAVYMTRIAADGSADAFFPDLEHDPGWRLDKRSADMEENGLLFRYEEYVPVKGE